MPNKGKQSIPVKAGKEVSKLTLPALHPVADFERVFDRLFGRGWPSLMHWRDTPLIGGHLFEAADIRLPSLDVIDRDNEILVRAEVPGIEKKDLDISLTDNLLTIKGQSSSENKEEKGDYHRHEISRSLFARSITLPGTVDSSKAAAVMKDGILEITLPKMASSKRRNIAVG